MENWFRLLIVLEILVCLGRCCQYPNFVQSRREASLVHDWSVQTMDKGHRVTLTISFEGMMMHSSVSRSGSEDKDAVLRHSSFRSFTRECKEQLGVNQDRYLSTNRFRGDHVSQYVCLGFIRRSRSVLQIRTSRLSDVFNRSLCEDSEMDLDNRVLINRLSFFSDYEECLVKGGYNIRIYDKTQQKGLCDAYDGETRLESECMPGDGLVFRFRYPHCRPRNMGMQTTQRAFCLASWTEAGYSYSVLRHDSQSYAWCLRYPTEESLRRLMDSFTSHLFRDAWCERTPIPNATDGYLRLDMTRDTLYGTSINPCADDYEACAYAKDPCSRASTSMTCAKTCNICVPDEWPATCVVPSHLHGRWIETTPERSDVVEIGNTTMVIFDNGIFHCVQWEKGENGPVLDDGKIVWEQMFVTTFSSGCRPRYSCVRFEKSRGAHSVLRYKLSQSETWPFLQRTDNTQIGCDRFVYRNDNEPFGSRYRSMDMKTLISETQRIYVDCKLPRPVEFEAEFGTSHCTCRGRLTQEGLATNKRISVFYDACPGLEREEQYNCLESTYSSGTKSWKIVGLSVRSADVVCLYFPATPESRFYLIKLADCIGGIEYRIAAGTLQPEATYIKIHAQYNPGLSYSLTKDNKELEKTKDLGNDHRELDQPESRSLGEDEYENGMNDDYFPGTGYSWYEYNDEPIVGDPTKGGGTALVHSHLFCMDVVEAIVVCLGIYFFIN